MARAGAGASWEDPCLPGCISSSMFPQWGSDYPICEYLSMYSCVLMGLYLRFFGEAVRSSRTCVSVQTSAAEMRICFKEKHFLVLFVQTMTRFETMGVQVGSPKSGEMSQNWSRSG